ncbi:hypothetical protein [Nitrogeniibacter aestuarii]|uniref:hypothetical protein n=1 Tax=Nitrogeniibacter aestuarii TaxID=2815343 RepID=UPI001D10E87F|nr:hypothetical protein [Nitrogeniibacter aestuarii]
MKQKSENRVVTMVTGLRHAVTLTVFSLLIVSWMQHESYANPNSPYYQDMSWALSMLIGFNALVFAIAFIVTFQRIQLDSRTGMVAFANLGTFYRMREIHPDKIEEVAIQRAFDSSSIMVDSLLLFEAQPATSQWRPSHKIIDHRLAPFRPDKRSALFDAVIAFIRNTNPDAVIPEQYR